MRAFGSEKPRGEFSDSLDCASFAHGGNTIICLRWRNSCCGHLKFRVYKGTSPWRVSGLPERSQDFLEGPETYSSWGAMFLGVCVWPKRENGRLGVSGDRCPECLNSGQNSGYTQEFLSQRRWGGGDWECTKYGFVPDILPKLWRLLRHSKNWKQNQQPLEVAQFEALNMMWTYPMSHTQWVPSREQAKWSKKKTINPILYFLVPSNLMCRFGAWLLPIQQGNWSPFHFVLKAMQFRHPLRVKNKIKWVWGTFNLSRGNKWGNLHSCSQTQPCIMYELNVPVSFSPTLQVVVEVPK